MRVVEINEVALLGFHGLEGGRVGERDQVDTSLNSFENCIYIFDRFNKHICSYSCMCLSYLV